MTQPVGPESLQPSRRGVVAAMSGGALLVGCSPAEIMTLGTPKAETGPFGPFVRIDPDGSVTVVSKHIELGQGSSTGMAAVVAEEMDADWSRVKVDLAPGDGKLYGNTSLGVQGTGGSTALNESWDQMRRAGATARAMFVQAAARRWNAPEGEITVRDGVVRHEAGGRSADFASLLPDAGRITPPANVRLKAPSEFTLIGTDRVRRKDTAAKSTGRPLYTQDVRLPGMLTAVVAHPPLFGAKLESVDDGEARKVPGVVDVVRIPTGVAVLATGFWAAKTGRDALKLRWDDRHAETRSSEEILAAYRDVADGKTAADWTPFETRGAPDDAFRGELVEASYEFPFLAHAAMEPMNCVAQVGGGKCKLTFASQIPSLDQLNTALTLKMLPGAVEVETLYAGGSFGRRATPDSDYVMEAVEIARRVGGMRPVKLVWTREDDMTRGRYRPMALHRVSVKLAADGYPAAWRHRVVVPSFVKGTLLMQGSFDDTTVEGVKGSPYLKAIPVVDARVSTPASKVTTLWWRSVGATHTALAMEHTLDQCARKAGKDPVEYRRELYRRAGAARHLRVLDLAAQKSGWGAPLEDGWSRGVAVHESFNTVVGNVAEVKMVDGRPKVRRVVVAVDCGVAVAPDQIRAQMEGGTFFGLAPTLYSRITLKGGRVEQTNFDTYHVLRMADAPDVETYILPSAERPTGCGEPGTPVVAPAVANALYAAGGPPISSLPLVRT